MGASSNFVALIRSLFEDFLSVVLPLRCHACGHPLPHTRRFICAGCTADLPLAGYEIDNNPLTEVLRSIKEGDVGMAYLKYEPRNRAAKLIKDFKYNGFSRLARYLGSLAAEEIRPSGIFDTVDLLIPIPLHRGKMLDRGYNQSLEIARGISEVTGIEIGKQLVAVRGHGTQTKLDRSGRQANVEDIFDVCRPEELEGRTILLVDDVFTTGATLMSAAKTVAGRCRNVRLRLFALGSAHH